MWQDCKLSAVQRKTACVEQSWWPEFDMFGSMPWCSFPWHKLLPMLRKRIVIQQSEFDPWVHILVFAEGDCCRFARKAFPRTQAFVDISVFLSWATPQHSPNASPMAIFKWKNFIEQLYTGIVGVNGRWGQVVEETACCHSAPGEIWKETLDNWQCGAYVSVNDIRMSAVKCSNLHSPHHVVETFRPFFVKVTGAAQCDFGLVQLQVNRKLLLNWICLGVQRNRLCHTAGPVQLMQPKFPCGQLNRHVRWH